MQQLVPTMTQDNLREEEIKNKPEVIDIESQAIQNLNEVFETETFNFAANYNILSKNKLNNPSSMEISGFTTSK